MPVTATLLVDYTRISLALHTDRLREAYDLAHQSLLAAVYFDLGSDQQNIPLYNDRVRNEVLSLLRHQYRYSEPPRMIRVIMIGESAGDTAAQTLIKATVEEVVPTVELLTSHHEYIAARGAAELAWRAMKLEQGKG